MLAFKNRIFLPPMAKELCVDGKAKQDLINYYLKQAKQGFGLIILEHAYVMPNGQASKGQLSIDSEENADILTKLAKALHNEGTKAVMQISHCGLKSKLLTNERLGPTAILADNTKEMSLAQIKEISAAFVAASKRVKAYGFDGVEVHSAHAYLLNQFYSPLTNKRQDEYGGNLENRLRLHIEILKGIRKELGDFPIFLRLGACDYEKGGNDLETAIKAAKILEPYLDYLDISGGMNGYQKHNAGDLCYFAEIAKAIKGTVNIPILTAGGIKTATTAEQVLKAGIADLVGIGRASLAPNFKLF